MNIKQKLYNHCQEFVNNKLQLIEKTIQSNKEGLNSETKSSAGDKHETGRAMLQLEMEKASQQIAVITEMIEVLDKIETQKTSKIICLGSLIKTTKANYYLAISVGEITINSVNFYAVSTNSPIGKQLLGKSIAAVIPFNEAVVLEIY